MSPGGFAHNFGSERMKEYWTLTRMGATFNSLSIYVTLIIQHFEWSRVRLIYVSDDQKEIMPGFCFLMSSALIAHRKSLGLTHEFHMYVPEAQSLDYIFHEKIGNDIGSEYLVLIILLLLSV